MTNRFLGKSTFCERAKFTAWRVGRARSGQLTEARRANKNMITPETRNGLLAIMVYAVAVTALQSVAAWCIPVCVPHVLLSAGTSGAASFAAPRATLMSTRLLRRWTQVILSSSQGHAFYAGHNPLTGAMLGWSTSAPSKMAPKRNSYLRPTMGAASMARAL